MRVVQYIKRRRGLRKSDSKKKEEPQKHDQSPSLNGHVPCQEVVGPVKQPQVRDVHDQKVVRRKPEKVDPLSNASVVNQSDIPEGHLLRCDGCSLIHFCEMATTGARGGAGDNGDADPGGAPTEEIRGGSEDDDDRVRSEGVGGGVSDASGGEDEQRGTRARGPNDTVVLNTKVDISKRFNPREEGHDFCKEYVKVLKKKLSDERRAKDLIRARYTEAKDDLFKTHKELDEWTKEGTGTAEGEENFEQLLKKYEDIGRRLGARVPGVCTLPLHRGTFCNDPDHREEFCNVPSHGGERRKCNVEEHERRCPVPGDQPHCSDPDHERPREDCNVPSHRMACLIPLTQEHCTKTQHDDVIEQKDELTRRLNESETNIAILREQTERCRKETEELSRSLLRISGEKNDLKVQLATVEKEKLLTDDAFTALSLWAEDATDHVKHYKALVATRAEEVEAAVTKLKKKDKEMSEARINAQAVRTERDTLYQDKKELEARLAEAEQRAETAGVAADAAAAPRRAAEVPEGERPGGRQQQRDSTEEEQPRSDQHDAAFERLAFPAQAKAFAADLRAHIKRVCALTSVPSAEARFEMLANLRGFERRMERIVDKETEYAADVENPDSLPVLHDFQLKAGGAILETETRIKQLRLATEAKLEVRPPPLPHEREETNPYPDPNDTMFGQPQAAQGDSPATATARSAGSSADTSKAGLGRGGWSAAGASGSGWFKGAGATSTGAQSSSSAAAFEGDPAFYQALPPPWNVEPAGERISFSDFTKLLTSGYVKKFKEKLADYPRFRTDFITNIHDARIPIVAKFKALAEVGGPDLEETAEGVDAGQEGYGMLVRKLELLYGGKDRQMVALVAGIKECELVRPGRVAEMQALVDAVTKYQAALPPERAHEGRSVQHAMDVMNRMSEELQLQYRQYCTQIGVPDEYNVPLLLRWLREVNIRHLYKRTDANKSSGAKKSTGSNAAAAAASKSRAVFYVGGQQMEVVPVQDGGSAATAATFTQKAGAPGRCWYCQDTHTLPNCPEFKSKPAATRKALVHGADLCAVCLKRGHYGNECQEAKCETCNGDHHTLIHGWGDAAGRGGGRGRGRGRGGRGRGRGQQQQAQDGAAADTSAPGGGSGAAAAAAGAGASTQATADQKKPAANQNSLAAKAAATAAPVKDGEALLYGGQAQQKSFHAATRFKQAAAAPSREESASADNGGQLPLWSAGINTFPRGSTFQFVSIASSPAKTNQADRVFNTATSSSKEEQPSQSEEEGQISLRFAVVRVHNNETKAFTLVNALLDDGATLSSLSQRAAKVLGLRGKVEKLEVTGYGGNVSICDAVYCDTTVESRNGHFSKAACLAVVPDPVGDLKAVNWHKAKAGWPHLADLPVEAPLGDGQVDMIIGVDQALFHQSIDERRGRNSVEPCARLTPAGWTVVGWTSAPQSGASQVVLKASSYDSVCLRGCAAPSLTRPPSEEREWLLGTHQGAVMDVPDPVQLLDGARVDPLPGPLEEKKGGVFVNAGDRAAIQLILRSWTQLESGRVVLPPLWKGPERPAANCSAAAEQWKRTDRSLRRQGVRSEYHEAILKWIKDGHAEWVDPGDRAGYFIPHFPVIRRDKATTKVRVVANGRAVFQGKSLNDFIHSGPKVVNSLVQVLLRFRRFPCAIIVDVESMFLRVAMPAADRQYHRFYYSDPDTGEEKPFQSIGHVFGSTGSPCIAITALKIGACRQESAHPLAADSILHSSMVDDVVDSVPTREEAAQLAEGLAAVSKSLDMGLHKWCTNQPDVLPAGARVVQEVRIEDKAGTEQAGEGGEQLGAEHKPLGLLWSAESDQMRFQYRRYEGETLTKLALLKLYMALFDPLGLIMPFIMSARIMYRDLWRLGCEWDEPVPDEVARAWRRWMAELEELDQFTFPRCIHKEEGGFLAAFSDASKDAYGAAVYLVGPTRTFLLYARGRVNSQEARTIPLLELLGAELAVIAAREVARALGMKLVEVEFFCDSQTALNWLRRPARDVSSHIARKLAQLREAVNPSKWWFVPTDLNPADVLSRGCTMHELRHHELWWNGPAFLRGPKTEWPQHSISAEDHPVVENEQALNKLIGIYKMQGRPLPKREKSPFDHISCWVRALRAADRVARAAAQWRSGKGGDETATCGEQVSAFVRALQLEQRCLWPEEERILRRGSPLPARHPWAKLNIVYEEGLIKMRGRSAGASLPVLTKESWLAELWLRHAHERLLAHGGGQKTLLAEAQKKVWIIGAAVLARRTIRGCAECRKQQPTPFIQPESPLPAFRCGSATGQTIFSHILMDECGPFLTRQGRGKAAQKRWILVLTCGASRALHLEVLQDRSAEAVADALVRFACRHTVPVKVVSDNAPEFSAAAELLKKGLRGGPEDGGEGWGQVDWSHYPPYAPNFGGAVEALVKLTKSTLSKVIKHKEHTDLDLAHCIKYVEYILNSRPLSAAGDDPLDPEPITPNTFLRDLGRLTSVSSPFGPSDMGAVSVRMREAVSTAWDELRKTIDPVTKAAHTVVGEKADIAIGDIVVALDVPPLPGRAVSIGRVERLWAGEDGVPRRADVSVRGKTYHRALRSLAPLCKGEKQEEAE